MGKGAPSGQDYKLFNIGVPGGKKRGGSLVATRRHPAFFHRYRKKKGKSAEGIHARRGGVIARRTTFIDRRKKERSFRCSGREANCNAIPIREGKRGSGEKAKAKADSVWIVTRGI